MKVKALPSHEEIGKMIAGTLSPVDEFVYHNEPAEENESRLFREQLLSAINHETVEQETERNVRIVSSFINHCKEEGLEIEEKYFESFFGA